ncbi:MAG: hypothetical protein WBA10_11865, partial [Elainellaceae cyanobacterium]
AWSTCYPVIPPPKNVADVRSAGDSNTTHKMESLMTTQYPSLPCGAAQLAAPQNPAADQSALRLDSPMEADPAIPTLIEPSPAPGCEHLRHIIIGSPDGVRHTINRLHLLQYVEWRLWTPLIAIGEQGIHITPAQGQVLSYLVQQRPIQ